MNGARAARCQVRPAGSPDPPAPGSHAAAPTRQGQVVPYALAARRETASVVDAARIIATIPNT